MNQQTRLTRLVISHYRCQQVSLQSITEYMSEDRGIYRADLDDEQSYVLRAFGYDVEATLLGQARVLDYLGQRPFLAPQVLRTKNGAALAADGSWTVLMISFIQGGMANFSPQHLLQLGACLGSLHTLSAKTCTEKNALPDSCLRPNQISQQALNQFIQLRRYIPQDLHPFHEDALNTIQHLQSAAAHLPTTILHGDCWPRNAIIAEDGDLALIDWDGSGLGPAILDLGYLLLTCHLGKSQLPAIQPDPLLISAVIKGYCQQRQIIPAELLLLQDAIRFDSARRAVLDGVFSITTRQNWREHPLLQKLLARNAASQGIAAIAKGFIEREMDREDIS